MEEPASDSALSSDPDFQAVMQSNDRLYNLKLLNRVVQRFPSNSKVQLALSFTYRGLGFYDEAIAASEKALRLAPNQSICWNELACGYFCRRQYSMAKEASATAIKLNPYNGTAWLVRAHCLFALTDYYGTIKAGSRAVQLRPNDPFAWALLAQSYAIIGDTARSSEASARAQLLQVSGTTPSQISKTAPVDDRNLNAQIGAFINTYIRAYESANAIETAGLFASKVDYLDDGRVDNGYILSDLRKQFARWPKYTLSNLRSVKIRDATRDGRTQVSFTFDFLAEHPGEQRWASGSAAATAILQRVGNQFQIVWIKQNVTNRKDNLTVR
jgi:tetratricopeptide (TPR) repeat protein